MMMPDKGRRAAKSRLTIGHKRYAWVVNKARAGTVAGAHSDRNEFMHTTPAPSPFQPSSPTRQSRPALWLGGALLCLSLTAVAGRATPVAQGAAQAAACAHCGTVASVTAVRQKGRGTGVGAVAGAVLGGVVGHQIGGGTGRQAMTAIGAVGGGFAGHEVERRARSETRFKVQVRMDDGSQRTFWRTQALAVGARVAVEGKALRVTGAASRATAS